MNFVHHCLLGLDKTIHPPNKSQIYTQLFMHGSTNASSKFMLMHLW